MIINGSWDEIWFKEFTLISIIHYYYLVFYISLLWIYFSILKIIIWNIFFPQILSKNLNHGPIIVCLQDALEYHWRIWKSWYWISCTTLYSQSISIPIHNETQSIPFLSKQTNLYKRLFKGFYNAKTLKL